MTDKYEPLRLTASPADDWTTLFDRADTANGWLGADGIYSAATSGIDALSSADAATKTVFIFSDTLLGDADETGRITRFCGMANHTAAVLMGVQPDRDRCRFRFGKGGNGALSGNLNLFTVPQWLFDCFVTGGALHIIAFSQVGWKPSQIDLLSVPLASDGEPQFAQYTRTAGIRALLAKPKGYDFAYGMAVLCNTVEAGAPHPDGYLYFYGYRDNYAAFSQKDLIVSRIRADEFPDFTHLSYWNGTAWCDDILASAPILERVSCEMSVTPIPSGAYRGKYIAVYTQDVQSARICYAIGDTPVGPFSAPVVCYTIPETGTPARGGKGQLYTYNAKAHPHLSPSGQLLISYNVNVQGDDFARHTSDYRPRFLLLDLPE